MNPEVFNLYIERLLHEINELTKNRLLIETQLRYVENLNSELNKKVKELESQIEKNTKKNAKKEVSSETF